jgi:hypothetical protein
MELPIGIMSNTELAEFILNSPLYRKVPFCPLQTVHFELNISEFFSGKPYNFYCPYDKTQTTFRIGKHWGQQLYLRSSDTPEFYRDKYDKISFSIHCIGVCQNCGHMMDVTFQIFSDKVWTDATFPELFVRKIGQYPSYERSPDKEVFNYLTDEDKEHYKKALANMSISYGIGAYSYLRRIIENEIKNLVKDISELDYTNATKVKAAFELYQTQVKDAWESYQSNHQMSNLINSITPFLPSSLIQNGHNTLKILHNHTSEGLHVLSDEECLEKAIHTDKLLQYVIKRVSGMKAEFADLKEAIKHLSK